MPGATLGRGCTAVAGSCCWGKRLMHPWQKLPSSRRGMNRQTVALAVLVCFCPRTSRRGSLLFQTLCPSHCFLLWLSFVSSIFFLLSFSCSFFFCVVFIFFFSFVLYVLCNYIDFSEVITFDLGDWQVRLSSDALRSVVKEIMETKVPCDRSDDWEWNDCMISLAMIWWDTNFLSKRRFAGFM